MVSSMPATAWWQTLGGGTQMARVDWADNEHRQVGVDFENSEQVAQYDSKQGSDRGAERQLVERLCISPGQVVVDLGCGSGSFSREAARAGARVRAIDVSQTMLEFLCGQRPARNYPISGGTRGLHLRGHAQLLGSVVSRFALHHLAG